MKLKNALNKLRPLLHLTKFTSKEALERGVSSATLAYYIKQKEIIRIRHGIYRGLDAPGVKDFRVEELFDAMQRVKEGVIFFTSALYLYQLTEEMPTQFWIAIKHSTLHRATPMTKIVRMRDLTLSKTTIRVSGVIMPILIVNAPL